MSYQSVLKQITKLNTSTKKCYTLEHSINGNYHLMKESNFIVIDESLTIISIVISALMRDKKRIKKST